LEKLLPKDRQIAFDIAQIEFYQAVLFGNAEQAAEALRRLDESLPVAAEGLEFYGPTITLASLTPEVGSLQQQLAGLGEPTAPRDRMQDIEADLACEGKRLSTAVANGNMELARTILMGIIRLHKEQIEMDLS
jgi:hypothetical protein